MRSIGFGLCLPVQCPWLPPRMHHSLSTCSQSSPTRTLRWSPHVELASSGHCSQKGEQGWQPKGSDKDQLKNNPPLHVNDGEELVAEPSSDDSGSGQCHRGPKANPQRPLWEHTHVLISLSKPPPKPCLLRDFRPTSICFLSYI